MPDETRSRPLSPAIEELHEWWAEIRRLESIEALLSWDQETGMPASAAIGRSQQLSTVATLLHDRLTSDQLQRAIEKALQAEGTPLESAVALEARRRSGRALAIPRRLAGELAAAGAVGAASWQQARAENSFDRFQPALERMIRLKREQAAAIGAASGDLYDALLDEYEPETRAADLDRLFSHLESELSPRARALPVAPAAAVAGGAPAYPLERQREVGLRVVAALGFDPARGRIDASAHPFCITIGPDDVRFTWRADVHDLRPGLYGFLHEAGHALYEQGLPPDLFESPAGGAASLGLHESQSRLWENLVGRSPGFCRWLWAWLPEHLPVPFSTAEQLWAHVHEMARGAIRVDADQVTYDLHILARYRLERSLLSGDLEVGELIDAWHAVYADLLGVTPADANHGVLQDIHWAIGLFGYFPTYTLGNLAASQLFEAACAELGDLDAGFAGGEFAPLLGWLGERVHRLAATVSPAEVIVRATGRPLQADAFLRHVHELFEQMSEAVG
ncbi:MAG TPA: carboxypeptidase M32 [Thermoanaerobaculia bacterium]|nr:carboxypeptidase M32 [Thermoanaerobaculia bacterium]